MCYKEERFSHQVLIDKARGFQWAIWWSHLSIWLSGMRNTFSSNCPSVSNLLHLKSIFTFLPEHPCRRGAV